MGKVLLKNVTWTKRERRSEGHVELPSIQHIWISPASKILFFPGSEGAVLSSDQVLGCLRSAKNVKVSDTISSKL
jgi:hypothetical protein